MIRFATISHYRETHFNFRNFGFELRIRNTALVAEELSLGLALTACESALKLKEF